MTLQIEQRLDGSFSGELEFATALFDPAAAQSFADDYMSVLRAVSAEDGVNRSLGSLMKSLSADGPESSLTSVAAGQAVRENDV